MDMQIDNSEMCYELKLEYYFLKIFFSIKIVHKGMESEGFPILAYIIMIKIMVTIFFFGLIIVITIFFPYNNYFVPIYQ